MNVLAYYRAVSLAMSLQPQNASECGAVTRSIVQSHILERSVAEAAAHVSELLEHGRTVECDGCLARIKPEDIYYVRDMYGDPLAGFGPCCCPLT